MTKAVLMRRVDRIVDVARESDWTCSFAPGEGPGTYVVFTDKGDVRYIITFYAFGEVIVVKDIRNNTSFECPIAGVINLLRDW